MTATDTFLQHWYFHLPNLAMAAMIYTLIGYFVLAVVFSYFKKKDAVILKVFESVTRPVLVGVRFITPAIVPNGLIPVFAIAWLMSLRMFWFLTCVAIGMRPQIGA
jgi:YggT family protein